MTVLLVDATNQLHADFYASGAGATQQMERRVARIVEQCNMETAYFCFDGNSPFRYALSTDYKSDRPPKSDELLTEIGMAKETLVKNWNCFQSDEFEADDLIASLSVREGRKWSCYSTDTDMHQILRPGWVNQLKKAASPNYWYTAEMLEKEYGVTPERWVDFTIVAGKAGQWPGAKGYGKVRATQLFQQFGTDLSWILTHLDLISEKALTEKYKLALVELRDNLELATQLVELRKDVPLEDAWMNK